MLGLFDQLGWLTGWVGPYPPNIRIHLGIHIRHGIHICLGICILHGIRIPLGIHNRHSICIHLGIHIRHGIRTRIIRFRSRKNIKYQYSFIKKNLAVETSSTYGPGPVGSRGPDRPGLSSWTTGR